MSEIFDERKQYIRFDGDNYTIIRRSHPESGRTKLYHIVNGNLGKERVRSTRLWYTTFAELLSESGLQLNTFKLCDVNRSLFSLYREWYGII